MPAAANRTALILAAHGERQVPDANHLLMEHAGALAARLDSLAVTCGVLNGEPSIEAALESLAERDAGRLLIYPLFMSGGYFVNKVLPERVTESGIGLAPEILLPLGLDPGLDALMMADALNAAESRGFAPEHTRLLVAGHGSKFGPASAQATRNMGERLAALRRFAEVDAAFLEEQPFITDALAARKDPVVVSGFFASQGMHSSRDIPQAIRQSGADAVYTGPAGASALVRDLIAASVETALRAVRE